MDIAKQLEQIEAAGKPVLAIVEEMAPDVAAVIASGGHSGVVQLLTDLFAHVGEIRNAVNGVTLAVQQLVNENGAKVPATRSWPGPVEDAPAQQLAPLPVGGPGAVL